MTESQKTKMETQSRQSRTPASRGNGRNGHHTSQGLLSWYSAQRPDPNLAYALTTNGYVLL